MPPEKYVDLLIQELQARAPFVGPRPLSTLYFGGGTPSLIPPAQIVELIEQLSKAGFTLKDSTEVTIEINPATISSESMRIYLDGGINRFSVGAQTFDDALLKRVHREHNAQQTRETLNLLKKFSVNFSFDLLFALPGQTTEILARDLEEVREYQPPHVSAYCLTVAESHPMARTRLPEDRQLEMFEMIYQALSERNYEDYEISNYAQRGFESRHNLLYWQDGEFLGLGLSAHSYLKQGSFGLRFWNPSNILDYTKKVEKLATLAPQTLLQTLSKSEYEDLQEHEALTDFCHTSLRLKQGLDWEELGRRFPERRELVKDRLNNALRNKYIEMSDRGVCLNRRGVHLSNQVFQELTFLAEDLHPLVD